MIEPPDDTDQPTPESTPEPDFGPLPVLRQEESFIAVSKPSGLLVHRDKNYPEAHAALQIVRDQTEQYVYPFHRLDRATSGILMFGFSSDSAAALQKSLSAPDAHKDYLALMRYPGNGKDLGASWTMDRPLTDENPSRPRAAISRPMASRNICRGRPPRSARINSGTIPSTDSRGAGR